MPAEVIAEANQVEAKADSKSALASALHDVWIRLKGLPRWAYVAALTAMLLFAFIGVYLSLGAGSVKLRIVCQHSFRAADLSVVVDGKIVYAGSLSGNSRKRFGLFDKSSGGSLAGLFGELIVTFSAYRATPAARRPLSQASSLAAPANTQ